MSRFTTFEQLHQACNEHFEFFLRRAKERGGDVAQVEAEATLAQALLAHLESSPVGSQFHPFQWLDAQGRNQGDMALLLNILPAFVGYLGLLSTRFQHDEAGLIPLEVVREMLTNGSAEYNSHLLTESNVGLYYVRCDPFEPASAE